MKRKFIDPRSGRIYTEAQVRAMKGNFLPNGVHKKYLQPYSGEEAVKKVVEPEENTIQKVVPEVDQKEAKSLEKNSKKK